jgi:hypothetical protein
MAVMLIQDRVRRAGAAGALALAACLLPQVAAAHPSFHIGALGDFDGDRQPDQAVALPQGTVEGGYRYRIDVRLSSHAATTFEIDSHVPGGLRLSARDIDGDHDLDLVITSEFGRELVGIWINDGNGNFTRDLTSQNRPAIWQEATQHARAFRDETPRAPALATAPVNAIPMSSRFGPLSQYPLSFPISAACAPSDRLNPGSPLRAPPTSSI